MLERNLTLGKMKNKIQLLKTKLGKKPRSKSRKKFKKKRRKGPRKGRSSKRSKKKRKKSRSKRLRKRNKAGPNRRRGWRGWMHTIVCNNVLFHLTNWQALVPVSHHFQTIQVRSQRIWMLVYTLTENWVTLCVTLSTLSSWKIQNSWLDIIRRLRPQTDTRMRGLLHDLLPEN